eukprot:COSAG01_NODE_202_length_22130_cov_167.927239_4_plen_184_part_00
MPSLSSLRRGEDLSSSTGCRPSIGTTCRASACPSFPSTCWSASQSQSYRTCSPRPATSERLALLARLGRTLRKLVGLNGRSTVRIEFPQPVMPWARHACLSNSGSLSMGAATSFRCPPRCTTPLMPPIPSTSAQPTLASPGKYTLRVTAPRVVTGAAMYLGPSTVQQLLSEFERQPGKQPSMR